MISENKRGIVLLHFYTHLYCLENDNNENHFYNENTFQGISRSLVVRTLPSLLGAQA